MIVKIRIALIKRSIKFYVFLIFYIFGVEDLLFIFVMLMSKSLANS